MELYIPREVGVEVEVAGASAGNNRCITSFNGTQAAGIIFGIT